MLGRFHSVESSARDEIYVYELGPWCTIFIFLPFLDQAVFSTSLVIAWDEGIGCTSHV